MENLRLTFQRFEKEAKEKRGHFSLLSIFHAGETKRRGTFSIFHTGRRQK
jgi:hypothetical protein